MKFRTVALLAIILAGCQTVEEVSTPEVCDEMFVETLRQIEESHETVLSIRQTIKESERKGDTVSAEANRKSLESYKASIGGNIKYIEDQLIKNCDNSKFRPELLEQLKDVKKYMNEKEEDVAETEGMPDLRISNITSTFVPYRMDAFNRCEGPFLDLVFTVTNNGADFPRPVDIEYFSERAQRPADELQFFTMVSELDFGKDMRKQFNLEITGASGGYIKSGASFNIPATLKIDYNQTHAKATAHVTGAAFLKFGSGATYQTEIDVPLWDIHTESHMVVQSKDEDGKPTLIAKATVSNKGPTATPGPIEGSFILKDAVTGRFITSWSGKTEGPVSGTADMYFKESYTGQKLEKVIVQSSIIPLCPDGTVGNLADGDTKNNIRDLKESGASQTSAVSSSVSSGQ